jgi:hypothetical protein
MASLTVLLTPLMPSTIFAAVVGSSVVVKLSLILTSLSHPIKIPLEWFLLRNPCTGTYAP